LSGKLFSDFDLIKTMSYRRFTALGTASQVPTRERNHNGYFLRWDEHGFLFDPGEATQRQMLFAGIAASEITKIFITHFHGDHCLGLPGVLQRLSLDRIAHGVEVYFPASGRKYFENLKNASIYHEAVEIKACPFEQNGVIFEDENLIIETRKLNHTAEAWGFRLQEKDSVTMLPEKLNELGIAGRDVGKLKSQGKIEIGGKIIRREAVSVFKRGQIFAFVMDTGVCPAIIELAREADCFVCESTYLSNETAEAAAYKHLTARQAAEFARDARAKQLVLTHFSQRYASIAEFEKEACAIFPNSIAVADNQQIEIKRKTTSK
jgi:ribonuclease Z